MTARKMLKVGKGRRKCRTCWGGAGRRTELLLECLRLPVELPLAVDDGKKDRVTHKHCRECILVTFPSVPLT